MAGDNDPVEGSSEDETKRKFREALERKKAAGVSFAVIVGALTVLCLAAILIQERRTA